MNDEGAGLSTGAAVLLSGLGVVVVVFAGIAGVLRQ